jgi:hypothetical protein
LAGIALELGALVFLGYVVMQRRRPSTKPCAEVSEHQGDKTEDFITDEADEGARYYRASDSDVELVAGFYSDGRIRLTDAQRRRFAGMLQGSHADLLELASNEWSEVFLRVTPTGRMQLELRGGPYDTHVLTCESFDALGTTQD